MHPETKKALMRFALLLAVIGGALVYMRFNPPESPYDPSNFMECREGYERVYVGEADRDGNVEYHCRRPQ